MDFTEMLQKRIAATGSGLCVGLDVRAKNADEARAFIRDVIAQTGASLRDRSRRSPKGRPATSRR